jgi:uncharacterized protein (DUF433 family)
MTPALLLTLTAASCWLVGIGHTATYRSMVMGDQDAAYRSVTPLDGVWFALAVLGILGAHELGHWLAARHHRLPVSVPLFIPGPTFAGTFGAFMRFRQKPPTRRCAFDIAAAGPLAGFAALRRRDGCRPLFNNPRLPSIMNDMTRQSDSVVHSDPEISGGTPVFRGTRVPVRSLFDHLEQGVTVDEFLNDFPSVSKEQALATLTMARNFVLNHARSA